MMATSVNRAMRLRVTVWSPIEIPMGSRKVRLRFRLRRVDSDGGDLPEIRLAAFLQVGETGTYAVDPQSGQLTRDANVREVALAAGLKSVDGEFFVDVPGSAIDLTHQVYLIFADRNAPVGRVAVPITLTTSQRNRRRKKEDKFKRSHGFVQLMPGSLESPDFVIYCTARPYGTFERGWLDLAVSFLPRRMSAPRFLEMGSFPDPSLDGGPEGLSAILWSYSEELDQIDPADRPRLARELGQLLWSKLPTPFRRFFWNGAEDVPPMSQQRDSAILISSMEWSFPWELIWPPRHDSEDLGMFGQLFAMSRWAHGAALSDSTIVANVAMIATKIGDSAADREIDRMRAFATTLGTSLLLKERRVKPSDYRLVFRPGTAEAIHIRTHGDPQRLQIYDVPLATWFEARRIPNQAYRRIAQPPFAFLNSCRTSAPSRAAVTSVTDPDGWPERLFRAGCAAFIVTYWPVALDTQVDVSNVYYDALERHGSIAEAMQTVRQAAVNLPFAFRSTPLGYTVCGHPNAKVIGQISPC